MATSNDVPTLDVGSHGAASFSRLPLAEAYSPTWANEICLVARRAAGDPRFDERCDFFRPVYSIVLELEELGLHLPRAAFPRIKGKRISGNGMALAALSAPAIPLPAIPLPAIRLPVLRLPAIPLSNSRLIAPLQLLFQSVPLIQDVQAPSLPEQFVRHAASQEVTTTAAACE